MPLACSIPEVTDLLRVERDDYDEGDPQQHEDGRLQPLAAAAQLEARYLSLEDEDGEADDGEDLEDRHAEAVFWLSFFKPPCWRHESGRCSSFRKRRPSAREAKRACLVERKR